MVASTRSRFTIDDAPLAKLSANQNQDTWGKIFANVTGGNGEIKNEDEKNDNVVDEHD